MSSFRSPCSYFFLPFLWLSLSQWPGCWPATCPASPPSPTTRSTAVRFSHGWRYLLVYRLLLQCLLESHSEGTTPFIYFNISSALSIFKWNRILKVKKVPASLSADAQNSAAFFFYLFFFIFGCKCREGAWPPRGQPADADTVWQSHRLPA